MTRLFAVMRRPLSIAEHLCRGCASSVGRLLRLLAGFFLRFLALGYLTLLVGIPVGWTLWKAFGSGLGPVASAVSDPSAVHAVYLSVLIAGIAVVVNTTFGVLMALVIVRHPFPGSWLVNAVVDLPLGLSPVVVGFAVLLLYGSNGWLGPWLSAHSITVAYALPGMILATILVTLPFVVREVVPVVREVGTQQEEAARTLGATSLQTFFRITLPAISAGIIYGVVLTVARALGEFGAVTVVSSNIVGQSQTLTLYIDYLFGQAANQAEVYVLAVELGLLAVATLVLMSWIRNRGVEKA
jgi:sulfate transport system permease protein